MTSRAAVLLSRYVKTPQVSWFKGTLANNGAITGMSAGVIGGLPGVYTAGRPYKGFIPLNSPNGLRPIWALYSSAGADLVLDLSNQGGGLSLSYFQKVILEDGTGAIQTFLTSAATFASGGTGPTGEATWTWGTGAARVWAAGDATEVKNVWVI